MGIVRIHSWWLPVSFQQYIRPDLTKNRITSAALRFDLLPWELLSVRAGNIFIGHELGGGQVAIGARPNRLFECNGERLWDDGPRYGAYITFPIGEATPLATPCGCITAVDFIGRSLVQPSRLFITRRGLTTFHRIT